MDGSGLHFQDIVVKAGVWVRVRNFEEHKFRSVFLSRLGSDTSLFGALVPGSGVHPERAEDS